MSVDQPTNPGAPEMIFGTLGKPLNSGELGVLLAGAGVGKTACLTQIALNHLFRGFPVLHVCIDELPDKIKAWYHEFLKNIVASEPGESFSKLQQRIEPLRFILAYLHHTFNPGKLERSLQDLIDQAKFHPAMVVLDGMDFDRVSRSTIEALQEFAKKHNVSFWMSARTHRHISIANDRGIPYPCHELDDLFHAIVLLETIPDSSIRVKVLKREDRYQPEQPEVFLNPQTFLLQKA